MTGRLARGIKNQILEAVSAPGVAVLPYPLQRSVVRGVSELAERVGRPDLTAMWSGQSANLLRHACAAELMESLIAGVSVATARWAHPDG